MAEIPDVVALETITVEWGNAIRDRTIQRYTDTTERDSLIPSPADGDLSFLEDSGALAVYYSGSWRGLMPPGAVLPYAGATTPNGFLLCNGATVSRTTYAALFAAIGTAFGAGDGSTTFTIPDMRQKFPLGVAASGTGSTRGATGGAIDHGHTGGLHSHGWGTQSTAAAGDHTHTGPSHSHSFSDSFVTGFESGIDVPVPGGTTVFSASADEHTHSGSVSGTTGTGGTGATGIGGSHSHTISVPTTAASSIAETNGNNPPFLALHYIIKT